MTMAQHDQFHARLKRINSGKTSHWTVPGEGLASKREEERVKNIRNVTGRRKAAKKGGSILLLPVALLTGAASVVAGRWLTYAYLGADGPVGVDVTEILGPVLSDVLVAGVLAVLCLFIFRLSSTLLAAAQMAAFGGVLFYESELVHLVPEAYAALYPPTWVNEMLATPSVILPLIGA